MDTNYLSQRESKRKKYVCRVREKERNGSVGKMEKSKLAALTRQSNFKIAIVQRENEIQIESVLLFVNEKGSESYFHS